MKEKDYYLTPNLQIYWLQMLFGGGMATTTILKSIQMDRASRSEQAKFWSPMSFLSRESLEKWNAISFLTWIFWGAFYFAHTHVLLCVFLLLELVGWWDQINSFKRTGGQKKEHLKVLQEKIYSSVPSMPYWRKVASQRLPIYYTFLCLFSACAGTTWHFKTS